MKNLKPLFATLMCAVFCMTLTLLFTGCGPLAGGNGSSSGNGGGTGDNSGKSLEIPLDEFTLQDYDVAESQDPDSPKFGSSYNQETHVLVSNGGAGFGRWWPHIEASEYNSVKIQYKVKEGCSFGTIFAISYLISETENYHVAYYIPSYLTEYEIPLLEDKKSVIEGFYTYTLGKPAQNTEIKFDSITLETKTVTAPSNPNYSSLPAVVDSAPAGKKPINRNLDAFDIINDMGPGTNLCDPFWACGEVIDFGLDTWTVWGGQIPTYKERVDELIGMGFTSIRVDVSWGAHMMDDNCTIDPRFMTQVKECVDYCLDQGMYVILNECLSYKYPDEEYSFYYKGYCLGRNEYSYSKKFLTRVWEQITTAFNNSYDEHLIFEFVNEPNESPEKFDEHISADAYDILEEYYQAMLDIVRASGGNNAKRFCIVSAMGSGKYPDIECNPDYLTLPTDSSGTGRIIFCTHMYPMLGAGGEPFANTQYTAIHRANLQNTYQNLCNWYVDNAENPIPVIATEFGTNSYAPLGERLACIEDYIGTYMGHEGGGINILLFNYSPSLIDFSQTPFAWPADHKTCFEYYVNLFNDTSTPRPSATPVTRPEKAGINLLKEEIIWEGENWDANHMHIDASDLGILPDETTLKITVETMGSSPHKLLLRYIDCFQGYNGIGFYVQEDDVQNATLLTYAPGEGGYECNLQVTESATIVLALDEADTDCLAFGGLLLSGSNIKITSVVFE